MSDIAIKNFGKIIGGKIHFFKPHLYQTIIDKYEGKDIVVIVQERFEDTTTDQHGYYRAGIIRATCMETELFGGWTESDIHDFFAERFLSYTKQKELGGKAVNVLKTESTADIGKKKMRKFIDDVLNFLAEHDIFPLSPENYVMTKYRTTKG